MVLLFLGRMIGGLLLHNWMNSMTNHMTNMRERNRIYNDAIHRGRRGNSLRHWMFCVPEQVLCIYP